MKRIISFVLMLFILVSLASCDDKKSESGESAKAEVGSLTTIVKDICAANNLTKGKTFSSESTEPGKYLDKDLISGYYGSLFDAPDFSLIEEYCVYIEDFNTNLRIEIGIFKVFDSKNNTMVSDFIKLRKDTILENAINYPDVDAEPFKNVIIETVGNYTYYIAVKENRNAINTTIREKLGA